MKPSQLSLFIKRFLPQTREAWLRFRCDGNPFGSGYKMDIHITPALIWTPWQKSVLASCKELGITTWSGSFGVEFWTWKCVISAGWSKNEAS